jgi:hypothetical protein
MLWKLLQKYIMNPEFVEEACFGRSSGRSLFTFIGTFSSSSIFC